ncbi:ATP-dependent RNA helicase DEAH11, chloroplastic-like protein, partial [Tanacetum coccineum]
VHLRGPSLPPDVMKKVVDKFGPDLHGLKERFLGSDFSLNTRYHTISFRGTKHPHVPYVSVRLRWLPSGKLSLLQTEKMDELFRASLGSFVESSCGKYRFSLHQTALQCIKWHKVKILGDRWLVGREWMKDKEDVKHCPVCRFTIEKIDGATILNAGAGYISAGRALLILTSKQTSEE